MVPGHPSEYNVNVGCLCHIACICSWKMPTRCCPGAPLVCLVTRITAWLSAPMTTDQMCALVYFLFLFYFLFISLHCLLELYSTSDITYRSFCCFYSALFSHFLSPQALRSCGHEAKNCLS